MWILLVFAFPLRDMAYIYIEEPSTVNTNLWTIFGGKIKVILQMHYIPLFKNIFYLQLYKNKGIAFPNDIGRDAYIV